MTVGQLISDRWSVILCGSRDMATRRRARSDGDKLTRRRVILDTAWRLFQELPYQAIAMSAIAQRTGLAKGTIYLYFKTKEALFLALQEQQLLAWFREVDGALTQERAVWTSGDVASVLCGTLEQHP